MSKPARIAGIIALSIAGLLIVLFIAVIIVVNTDWFRNFVKQKIITATEESTGGDVDLASFDFDLWGLHATLNGFVIHGKEPRTAPPLFRAQRIYADVALALGARYYVTIEQLDIDRPEAYIAVYPDGTTNLPVPPKKRESNEPPLQTVVDLAIGRFDLRNGSFTFADTKMPLDATGRNLGVLLTFNPADKTYQGRLSIQPLVLHYATHQPLDVNIAVPVMLAANAVDIQNARIQTSRSALTIDASLKNFKALEASGRLTGNLSVRDIGETAGIKVSSETGESLPGAVNANIAFRKDPSGIVIDTGQLALGNTRFDASGTLEMQNDAVNFKGNIDLTQIGRIFQLPQRPEGTVQVTGTASLTPGGGYQITGKVRGNDVSFTQSGKRYSDINLASSVRVTPNRVELPDLHLNAFGGEFAGSVSLANMQQLELKGDLRRFNLNTLSEALTGKPSGYSGVVSGPVEVAGNLKAPGAKGLTANANLTISPAAGPNPVSGRVVAHYTGATGALRLDNSYVALPHSRLALSGSVGNIQVHFSSTNLDDFLAALRIASPQAKEMPVSLRPGSRITFDGAISGPVSAPHIAGRLAMGAFTAQGRPFDGFVANLNASPSGASVQNARLTSGKSQIAINASVGLNHWKAEPTEPIKVAASIQNGQAADLAALAGRKDAPVSGTLNVSVNLDGTIGNPLGAAQISLVDGEAYGQPVDSLQVRVNLSDQLVTLQDATLISGSSRLDASGTFRHPERSFTTGHIEAKVTTNDISLAAVQLVAEKRPGLGGILNTNIQVAADLNEVNGRTQFKLDAVNGSLNLRGLQAEGQQYGNLNATARTEGDTVHYRLVSDFAGSSVDATGATRLEPNYPTTLDASVKSLAVARALAVAGRGDIPVTGSLTGFVHFDGTVDNPRANLNVTLADAVLYGEPFNSIEARVNYGPQAIEAPQLNIVMPAGRIELSATYTHAPNNLKDGQAKFSIRTSEIQLAGVQTVQKYRRGLAGELQIRADGGARVQPGAGAQARVLLTALDGNIGVTDLRINNSNLGDFRLAANTKGNQLNFDLASNLGGSTIKGAGQAILASDYPVKANLTFANVTYAGLRPLIGSENPGPARFTAGVSGAVSIQGPIMTPKALSGRVELSQLQVASASPTPTGGVPVAIRNDGPIIATLNKSAVKIEQAHIVGPRTDIKLAGTADLNERSPLNLTVAASTNLGILQNMVRGIYSEGDIILDAGVRGSFSQPLLTGKLVLRNASLNYIDFPNGIANANGLIVFNGTSATIQNLTAKSGGGDVSASGFVNFGPPTLAYGLTASAKNVRVRYQGASVVSTSDVRLTGTAQRSLLSGTVVLNRLGFAPRQDFGSFLSRGAEPPQVPSAPVGPLAGMRLDIRIRTAPDVAVETPLAQSIQANADLTLRGTAAQPGMLGRVNITQAELVFFGSKYEIHQGSVAFYDPNRIHPILNIDLQTTTKGVQVVLNVSGPVENMKLTYHSDPPLQFQELVALLATGKVPTTDPTLLANQPSTPPQSFQQMGESALVSRAIANPISNQLERVFGVTSLKIDPTFTSGSELPQARMTLQQQITSGLTFTYITNLQQSNDLIVRIEWAMNSRWSAIATREENGMFGIDIFYKRRIR
jgi:translocation and assembly module TamB